MDSTATAQTSSEPTSTEAVATTTAANGTSESTTPTTGTESIIFSDAAAKKVKQLIEEEGNPELKLRVFVAGGGCSGFQYGFTFDEEISDDDYQFEKFDVKMLIDAMSCQYLQGAEIDYQEKLEGSQFVIHNPNVKSTCGCGSSFDV